MKNKHAQLKLFTVFSLLLLLGTLNAMSQEKRITINVKNVSLKNVFNIIENQTTYRFSYRSVVIDADENISISESNATVPAVLDQALKGRNLEYSIVSAKSIVISDKRKDLAIPFGTKKIAGTIKDEKGESIIGANITVKGTSIGSITDIDGKFNLEVPNEGILVISYIGFLSQEIKINGKSSFNITLKEDLKTLDEVVVIGYGIVKKKDLTGSVATLKNKEISAVPVSNALEALQGKISGLDMTKSSGEAGSSLNFTLRGNRSLNASNAPLILVDGIQYGSTVDINTSDIESVQVLKDASSTAIYGSRGANGVILITTKKGKIGKPVVSFNMYAGIQSDAGLADIQTGEEYVTFKKEAYRTNGITDEAKIFNAAELDFINQRKYINWQDLCIDHGSLQNYELSLMGGTELSTFNFSLGMYDEDGILKNDDLRRYNGLISGDYRLLNNVKVGANVLYTYREKNARQDPLNQANKIIPLGNVYNEDGSVNKYPASNTSISPIADEMSGNYRNNTIYKRLFSTSYLEWGIIKGLQFKTTLGVDMQDSRQGIYFGKYTINGGGNQSGSSVNNTSINTITWENILTWSKAIKKHDFTILLGHSLYDYVYENSTAGGKNQVSSTTSFHDIGSNASDKSIGSSRIENRMVSFFGRLNYKFNEKYLLTVSLRSDGASPLAKGHKWGYFPSTAVAWRVNEENFMRNLDFVSDLKLRASWGISGNSAIEPYATLGSLGTSTYAFDETPAYGYYPSAISNPALKWEKTSTYNIALDFGLFKGRVSGSIEYYRSNTQDLLMSRLIPATSGYTEVMENVGKTRNQGVEIVLSTINFDSHNTDGFKWNTDFTFYKNKEEIVELVSGMQRDLSNSWFVGSPIQVYYDYEKVGIWQSNEETEAAKYGQKPGDIKVKDQNKDGKIDADNDRIIVGTPRPDFTISMNNRWSYKNLDLSIFLYARKGQTIKSEASGNYKISGMENGPRVDYWTPENPTNSHPRPNMNKNENAAYMSTLYYADGSFLKIRDVTLGYTVPQKLLDKIGITNLRIYGTMKNFFTFSHMKPYDPERGGSLSFPMTRQLIFGMNLSF